MNNQYVKYTIVFLEIILLFSLVVCLLRFNGSVPDEDLGSDITDVPSEEPSPDDNTAENPDNIPSEDENPPVDDVPTEDITPTPEVVDFSKMSYVAFGDSITWGWVNSLQMDFPYPNLVAEKIGFSSVYNAGVPAGTLGVNNVGFPCVTDAILASEVQYDIISVMLGVNDYSVSVPLGDIDDNTKDTVYGSLNLIADHLSTYSRDSFVFFMTPYKCKLTTGTYKNKNDAGYTLADVVTAIKEVAALYNIPVLDMFNEGQFEKEMYNYNSDGVHPSQEFIREYTAPQIEAFIRQNYSNKR